MSCSSNTSQHCFTNADQRYDITELQAINTPCANGNEAFLLRTGMHFCSVLRAALLFVNTARMCARKAYVEAQQLKREYDAVAESIEPRVGATEYTHRW